MAKKKIDEKSKVGDIDEEVEKKIELVKREIDKEVIAETEEMFENVEKMNSGYGLGSVIFPCPCCGKTKIKRNFHERQIATKYRCSACGFEGPN